MEKERNIWDVLNNLICHKKHEASDMALFNSFVITRAIAKYQDCIFYANEINCMRDITPQMVYDFYFYAIPPKKRFAKWFKPSYDQRLIQFLINYFSVSYSVAEKYYDLLTDDQKKYILKMEGGAK